MADNSTQVVQIKFEIRERRIARTFANSWRTTASNLKYHPVVERGFLDAERQFYEDTKTTRLENVA